MAAAVRELTARGAPPNAAEVALLRQQVATRLLLAALAASRRSAGNAEPGRDPAPYASARAATGAAPLLSRDIAASLRGSAAGPVILPPACDAAPLHHELVRLAATSRMTLTAQAATGTRTDRVAWLSEVEADEAGLPALATAIRSLKALTAELNAAGATFGGCDRLVVPARAQVAAFASDNAGGYVPHWDATSLPQQPGVFTNRRRCAAVMYACAPDWQAERDGGCLRCHVGAPPPTGLDADAQAGIKEAALQPGGPWRYVDVAPLCGRCVVFDCTALLHQVLPARRQRFAVTLWSYAPLA